MNFNPHSREGSDLMGYPNEVVKYTISIHTPVKGVTSCQWYSCKLKIISIHTPVKGVTPLPYLGYHKSPISIHTPVKGVTGLCSVEDLRAEAFQSTLP